MNNYPLYAKACSTETNEKEYGGVNRAAACFGCGDASTGSDTTGPADRGSGGDQPHSPASELAEVFKWSLFPEYPVRIAFRGRSQASGEYLGFLSSVKQLFGRWRCTLLPVEGLFEAALDKWLTHILHRLTPARRRPGDGGVGPRRTICIGFRTDVARFTSFSMTVQLIARCLVCFFRYGIV